MQAREELGEEDEQEVGDEQEKVERREGAEEERRRRRSHRRHRAVTTKPVHQLQAGEAMRSSLRGKHLLQHRHGGAPEAAARIAHLPRRRAGLLILPESRERGLLGQEAPALCCWVWLKRRIGGSDTEPRALFETKVAVRGRTQSCFVTAYREAGEMGMARAWGPA